MSDELNERDILKNYLVKDTVRIILLMNSDLELEEVISDIRCKSIDSLIDIHRSVSCELQENLNQESFNKRSI